jgi:hypothetical protein
LVEREGYGDQLRSVRALDISYEEARKAEIFNRAMLSGLETAVSQDDAKGIMFGSTTMALTPEMHRKANGRPLFMPGMTALRTIEHLWYDGLWPGGRERG